MAGAARDLYDLCVEWRDVCKEAVAATIGGAIDHAFVSPGPPATDCIPQLAVYAGGPAVADTAPLSPPLAPGHRVAETGAVHLINLTCVVVRCSPTIDNDGQVPDLADLEASAREVDEDVWAIWNWTRQKHRDGSLFASPSGKREVYLDPAFPIPSGNEEVGWQIPIRVQLGGYDPTP